MTGTTTLRPETAEQILEAVHWALDGETPLRIDGSGSKRAFGGVVDAAHRLDLSNLKGIATYEPAELFLTAKAGTRWDEIQSVLASERQRLDFEPMDMSRLLGEKYPPRNAVGTLGGIVACNLSGPRRVQTGAARDYVLGFTAVGGRGNLFKSGGRVIKNVTGFDLSKLMAGSFGVLAIMTEATLKTTPMPEKSRTVLVFGANDEHARALMSKALGSSFEVSGAAHIPAAIGGNSGVDHVANAAAAVTAIRVEGPGPSVESRCRSLKDLLAGPLAVEELHSARGNALWTEIRDAAMLPVGDDRTIWRVSVAPTDGPGLVAKIASTFQTDALYDWGGGLVWLSIVGDIAAQAASIRETVDARGGHATLIRGARTCNGADVPAFHPPASALQTLQQRIKNAFDPKNILNPGRVPGLLPG